MQVIPANIRPSQNGKSSKALRRDGWVPAIVYGKDKYNLAVIVKARELEQALRRQSANLPFKLNVNGQELDVMVYELQRHPVQGNVLHVDFKRFDKNERIHTSVPVHVVGDPEYGIPSLVRHQIEVACLPEDIPESFTVNVEGMNAGDVILVKDLDIPGNIDLGLDELEVVVSVLAPKAASDESAEAEAEAREVAEMAKAPVEEAKKG